MLYSCTHVAPLSVKGLKMLFGNWFHVQGGQCKKLLPIFRRDHGTLKSLVAVITLNIPVIDVDVETVLLKTPQSIEAN